MANLYVSIDESAGGKYVTRTRETLTRLHASAGYFPDAAPDADLLTVVLEEVFPDGMPGQFFASNVSLSNDYVLVALRPVLAAGRTWPFPAGRSLCIKGGFPVGSVAPRFSIVNVQEVADGPARDFERELDVMTYRARPANQRANHSAFTREFIESLPRVAADTALRLADWRNFLDWRERLVREKSLGLRYVARKLHEHGVTFHIVAPDKAAFDRQHKALRRADLLALGMDASEDAWTFKLPDKPVKRRKGKSEFGLGRIASVKSLDLQGVPEECNWRTARHFEVTVEWAEDELNDLQATEQPQDFYDKVAGSLPVHGFVASSIAGELSLIDRHRRAVEQLRDQGGYAPYLSAYLFDIRKANLPDAPVPVTQWNRADLNAHQRAAVEKILAAPDLCLVQGPPGTGKTTVIAEATYQFVRAGKKVLLASQAHLAVDNVLERLGNVPEIRAIRLGKSSKVSDAGQAFVEDRVLEGYYNNVAEACEKQYLGAWKEVDATVRDLEAWLERARPALHDYESQQETIRQLREQRSGLLADLRTAETRFDDECAENRRRADRRASLAELVHELQAGQLPAFTGLTGDEATRIAEAICALSEAGMNVPVAAEEWRAQPDNRTALFPLLVKRLQGLHNAIPQLQRDLVRLRDADPGGVAAIASEQRLAELARELAELETRLAQDGGDDLLPRWRALRRERDDLRAVGGLDEAFYGRVLADPVIVLQASRTRPADALAAVEAAVHALTLSVHQIEAAMREILARVNAEIAECAAQPERHAEVDAAEHALRLHDARVTKDEQVAETRRRSCERVLAETPKTARNGASVGSLDTAIPAAETALAAARQRRADSQVERAEWGGLLRQWISQLRDKNVQREDHERFVETYVTQCNVVAISCNEGDRTLEAKRQTYFDVVIIDEVSKATPPELLLPLLRGRKAVLVGDHRQLPPLFREGTEDIDWQTASEDSDSPETELTKDNLNRYERMVSASLFKEHFEHAEDELRQRLEIQFRMHPQIMYVVNYFYENRLTCGLRDPDVERAHNVTIPAVDGRQMLTPDRHVLWVDSSNDPLRRPVSEDGDHEGGSARTNRLEAKLIAEMLVKLDAASAAAGYGKQKGRRKVGVVSFYAPQLRVIREEIESRTGKRGRDQFAALDVEINSVQKYQGKEKPIVLVSLVRNFEHRVSARSNVAQYQFINVAFSRAQELLLVFGAARMFAGIEVTLPNMDAAGQTRRRVYQQIIEHLNREACFVSSDRLLDPVRYGARQAKHNWTANDRAGGRRD